MATTIFLVNPQTFPSSTSYLLDTYSAAAAYSLRQLKTGVTSVVRVRRSSDNAESDFTADEITDGTLTTWTGANDGFVVTWYDQSGNGNNVTQSTAGSQPKLVSSGSLLTKGSLPSVRYDGTNDYLTYNAGALATSDLSVFSVSSSTSTGNIGRVWSMSDSTNFTISASNDSRTTPTRNLIITNTSGTNFFGDLSTAYNDTNQRLLVSIFDSSKNYTAHDNGNNGGTGTYTGTVTLDAFNVGASHNGSSFVSYLSGDIQEVILFDTDESVNRTAIESDINTHYSIY